MDFQFPKIRFRYNIWVQDILVSVVFFFIIFFRLHPFLLHEIQRPEFFTNWGFLREHLLLPGGLVDYFSALFTQAFEYPLLGAFLLTSMVLAVSFLTRKIIQDLWKVGVHTLHWIPGLFFLLLFAHYSTPLSLIVGTIVGLISVWLFFNLRPKSAALRIGLYTIYAGLLYWFAGGPIWLFTVFCAIWEWVNSKSIVRGFVYLLISVVLCLVGSAFIFLTFFGQACTNNLPIESFYPPAFAGWGILVFFLLIGCLSFFIKVFREFLGEKSNQMRKNIWLAGTVLLLGILSVFAWTVFDTSLARYYMILRAGRKNDWGTVLRLGKDPVIMTPHTCLQVNRALWHKGCLLDSAFVYPQRNGTVGLIPNKDLCFENPEVASHLFLELGLLSEALHWNHELIEVLGETPEILDRMGVLYLLKGEKEAAKMYWRKLKYTLQGRKRARYLLKKIENKDLFEKDKTLLRLSSLIPEFEFISLADPSDRELSLLLKENPRNRMAFEYWMAYQLLDGNLDLAWRNIAKFKSLGYTRIPHHIQEALLLYASLSKDIELETLKPYIDYSLVLSFSKFQRVFAQHRSNRFSAQKALKEDFENTYWYYWWFLRSDK